MNRRSAVLTAAAALAGVVVTRLPFARTPATEEEIIIGRWRQIVIQTLGRADGEQAWRRWGDIVEHSARTYAKSWGQPLQDLERLERGGKLWAAEFGDWLKRYPEGGSL